MTAASNTIQKAAQQQQVPDLTAFQTFLEKIGLLGMYKALLEAIGKGEEINVEEEVQKVASTIKPKFT